MKRLPLILSFFLVAGTLLAETSPEPQVFVLALANPESFDRSLPTLRFANNDLTRVQRVLKRMTAVRDDQLVVLQDATRSRVRNAFAALSEQMRARGKASDMKFILKRWGKTTMIEKSSIAFATKANPISDRPIWNTMSAVNRVFI